MTAAFVLALAGVFGYNTLNSPSILVDLGGERTLDRREASRLAGVEPTDKRLYNRLERYRLNALNEALQRNNYGGHAQYKRDFTKVLNPHRPTLIIDVALLSIGSIDLINGFPWPPKPYDGEELKNSEAEFAEALTELELAVPNSTTWSGSAADAFTAQLKVMQDQVQAMQELDLRIKLALDKHSKDVQKAHYSNLLYVGVLCGIKEYVVWLMTNAKFQAAWWVQVIALGSFLSACLFGAELPLGMRSCDRKSDADTAKGEFAQAGKAAEFTNGASGPVRVGVAGESKVRSFANGATTWSGSAKPPSMASLIDMAGDSIAPEHRAALHAFASTPLVGASSQAQHAPSAHSSTPKPASTTDHATTRAAHTVKQNTKTSGNPTPPLAASPANDKAPIKTGMVHAQPSEELDPQDFSESAPHPKH